MRLRTHIATCTCIYFRDLNQMSHMIHNNKHFFLFRHAITNSRWCWTLCHHHVLRSPPCWGLSQVEGIQRHSKTFTIFGSPHVGHLSISEDLTSSKIPTQPSPFERTTFEDLHQRRGSPPLTQQSEKTQSSSDLHHLRPPPPTSIATMLGSPTLQIPVTILEDLCHCQAFLRH